MIYVHFVAPDQSLFYIYLFATFLPFSEVQTGKIPNTNSNTSGARDRETAILDCGLAKFNLANCSRTGFRDFAIASQRVQRPKQLSFSKPDSVSLVLLKSGPTLCMSFALEKESRGAEESKSDFAPKKIRLRRFSPRSYGTR